jgi:hypothetical protein
MAKYLINSTDIEIEEVSGTENLKFNFVPNSIVNLIYPIGSIYMSINNTNPSSLFGGTWQAWGSGCVPVGVDTGQTEFNTVEKTGGSITHTHNIDLSGAHSYALNTPGLHYITASETDGSASGDYITKSGTTLQPYITCYMWKRIS